MCSGAHWRSIPTGAKLQVAPQHHAEFTMSWPGSSGLDSLRPITRRLPPSAAKMKELSESYILVLNSGANDSLRQNSARVCLVSRSEHPFLVLLPMKWSSSVSVANLVPAVTQWVGWPIPASSETSATVALGKRRVTSLMGMGSQW